MDTRYLIDRRPAFDREQLIALIPQMRALARCLCDDRNEADALARDALARACRHGAVRHSHAGAKVWLLSLICDEFRSRRRRTSGASTGRAADASLPNSGAVPPLSTDACVSRAMMALSSAHREALALVDAAQLPLPEAAAVCGYSTATLEGRLAGAREALWAILTDAHPPGGTRAADRGAARVLS